MENIKKHTVQSSITGLSQKEAKSLLDKYGYNVFEQGKKLSPYKILVAQFKDILIIILLASTVLSVLMGEITEAIAIIIIIFINALLGFIQEFRTEKTMEALKNMAAPSARVYRDGAITQIPASEVVPKDIIVLETGDRVPSDAKLLEAYDLQIDESLLTGESLPSFKSTKISQNKNEHTSDKIYMGTMVTKGKGKAFTVATGMQTEMGKIAGMLTDITDEQTPLQKRLDQLGKYIAIGCLAICTIVSVTGILRGEKVFDMIITGISLAVAAVPEGLPAIVTIALALGVGRMLKRNALIRKLTAVETLGCATVVCSDKTGTLTENKMTVKRIFTYEHTADVTGSGLETEGSFISDNRRLNPHFCEDIMTTLQIATACNNAEISYQNGKGLFKKQQKTFSVNGDPTEAALIIAAAKAGITKENLEYDFERIDEMPFDSDRKCMSIIVKTKSGKYILFVKGAPDIIIDKCNFVHTNGKGKLLDYNTRSKILKANDDMANKALRVLAVAYRELPSMCAVSLELERNLVFTGLMGMIDPPRKEAYEAVKKCIRAGIKPVMITGDHKNTAAAIAKELGILREGELVLTGQELDGMSEQELQKIAPKVAVYARVNPAHKLRIVRQYKKNGNVVAMTGDGVNDAPAVKEADIGVSMGLTGTDVTKEASSIILLDDNFASMISAIEEGRVIYRNIRKFIRYLISCNIGEVLTMFVGMLMGLPVVLLPIQILWVNLVTDGLPAIALGLEPAEKDIMEQKPRGANEGIFSDGLLSLILFRGCIIAISTLGCFISILKMTGNVDTARTAAFTTLVFVQLIHVFECKSEKKNILHIPFFNNIFLILAVLCSVAMILLAVFMPFLQPVFSTIPLTFKELIYIAGYIAIGPLLSIIVFSGRKKAMPKA
jgi:Ca2+-transporting ATPase